MERLETERLIIRPFVMDDLEEAYRVLDLDLEWSGPGYTLERRKARLQFYIDLANWDDTRRIYGYRAVLLKATSTLIGICGFSPSLTPPEELALYDAQRIQANAPNTLELNIGYALASAYRHQGYAAEAVKALIAYGFNELKVPRIIAKTDRANENSMRLMQRVGMTVVRNPAGIVYPGAIGIIENPQSAK